MKIHVVTLMLTGYALSLFAAWMIFDRGLMAIFPTIGVALLFYNAMLTGYVVKSWKHL